MNYAIYVLIALQVIDLATTLTFLRDGSGKEANPLLTKLFSFIGVLPTLILIKGSFISLLVFSAPYIYIYAIYALICIYAWVVYNNIDIIRNSKT